MKHRQSITFFLSLLVAGVVSCLVGGYFFIRTFQAGDCDGGCNGSTLVSWVAGAFVAFLLIGYAWKKQRTKRGKNPYSALAALAAITVAIPGLLYLVQGSHPSSLLKTNQDNSYMLIAEREIPALRIAAGERCIFSTVDCHTNPSHIDAVCTQGPTTLKASDWPAFKRLPKEDFGIPPTEAVQTFPNACPKR